MIPTTLLRAGAFRAAGLLRSRVPDRMCRFKTTHDPRKCGLRRHGASAHTGAQFRNGYPSQRAISRAGS